MRYQTIEYHQDEYSKIGWLVLKRPDNLNALNTQMAIELSQCLKTLEDNEQIRTLIITGAGKKVSV